MMKHLEESKLEEANTIKNHSPRTPRLFLGKRTPDTPRRSRNSPRLSKGSLRSRINESGILKKKGSLSVDGAQRRTKSLDEIRNNNLHLSYNSGSDSDCCFEDLNREKVSKVSSDLRQRKPSVDNENYHVEMPIIKKDQMSEKSKNPDQVLEIVEVGDSECSEPLVKTSEPLVKSSELFVESSEPIVNPSKAVMKDSGALVKDSGVLVKDSGALVKQEKNEKTDKVPKEDIGMKKKDNKADRLQNEKKEMNETDRTRRKENKRMKKKDRLKYEEKERFDTQPSEQSIEGQSNKVEREVKDEISKDRKIKQTDVLKERAEAQEENSKETSQDDVGKREFGDDIIHGKDGQNIPLRKRGGNLQEARRLNAKDNLNETTNFEQNLKQRHDQERPAFEELAKNRQNIEQDSKTEIKSHEGRGSQEHKETFGLMDNKGGKQDPHKELLGLNEGLNLTNNNQNESQVNLTENNNQRQNSQEEVSKISDSQQEGNTRTRFHGIRLEPLPDNVTKLTPASNE